MPRRWEAHHVLSIAALADSMHDLDPDVAKYVQRCKAETKWCINQKPNMLALPRFGHSVKWYMEGIAKDGAAILKGLPPPFENWPHHDAQHTGKNAYLEEVTKMLKRFWEVLAKKQEPHEISSELLKDSLDKRSAAWKQKLRKRGQRSGGTDQAFKEALKGDNDRKWYMPFSMADDAVVEKRDFPMSIKDKAINRYKSIQNAISAGG